MVSIKNLFSSALLATAVFAQAPSTNFTASDIAALAASQNNPSSGTRSGWCTGQRTLCGTLCAGNANNTCDPGTLQWTCLCASNNSVPGLQYFANSMYSRECNTLQGNCNNTNANNLPAQEECARTYICGNGSDAQASAAVAGGSAASTSAAASSGSAAAASSASGSGVSSSTHAALAAASYSEFAPPMFVMMFVGAIATFL